MHLQAELWQWPGHNTFLRSLLHYTFTNLKRGGKIQLNLAAPWIFLPLPNVVAFLCLERFSEFLALCMRRAGFVSTSLGSKQHTLSLFLLRFPGGVGLGRGQGITPSAAPQWGWTLSMPDCHPLLCSASLQRFSWVPFVITLRLVSLVSALCSMCWSVSYCSNFSPKLTWRGCCLRWGVDKRALCN